ncbi:hypothetical protein VHEMI05413 [[Torrubiella] hemipterigena]|uniref:N-acetyltransferase domain-containing protein n=1 Tax=[Torrubiella] hemipterigena TaxID=1531966 RepID=A0A0A1TGK9_9HYPO|nr:hypothetical protein VHEMI05413 [[Torrubiella] hemipterigena]
MTGMNTKSATAPAMQRLAVPEDMDAITRLLCGNPDDGTLWQWPSLADDWYWLYCGMIQWLSTCFLDETRMIRVAVLPAENGEDAEQIVGMSIWLKRTAQQDGTIVAEPWAKPSSEQGRHISSSSIYCTNTAQPSTTY